MLGSSNVSSYKEEIDCCRLIDVKLIIRHAPFKAIVQPCNTLFPLKGPLCTYCPALSQNNDKLFWLLP
jgi:hypothetical protein